MVRFSTALRRLLCLSSASLEARRNLIEISDKRTVELTALITKLSTVKVKKLRHDMSYRGHNISFIGCIVPFSSSPINHTFRAKRAFL